MPLEDGGKKFIKYQVIGQNEVGVLTHFYKVLILNSLGKKTYDAYVLPNQAIDSSTPLEKFNTTVQII
ncbi:MAG: DNA/RNA non-specific endonuclease [Parachlamydiaceae bacterium]|nr:DNA/RNA non-specific endonuclease [Parachlamydiaceae bacterium]